MFRQLGYFASHYRIPIIVGWIAIAVILIATAPDLSTVSSTDQRDFLPADAPFAQAQQVFEQTFPAEFSASGTIILVDAGQGGSVRDTVVWDYIAEVEAWLKSDEAPDNIMDVTAPTTDPLMADALISPDQQIALISAAMNTPTDAVQTTEAVNQVEDWLKAHPPQGFKVYQTGEAGLNAQAEESTFTTIDRTIAITFALVIVALLVIYRSPVSPLIPLFSVTIAFITTIGLIGHLARLEIITVIAQVNALLVVVMYGAGTDYCLFLISRFREEMAEQPDVHLATRRTVHLVGETISSSAGTIFVGFMSMTFAEIGMIRSAGPMLAIGIVISLLAGLTLTPALLALLGNKAFFPGKASHRSPGRFYEMTSKLVSSRPLVAIVVIVALMLPFSVIGLSSEVNYDFVAELPESIDSVQAYHLLREHMGGGNLFPITVIVTGRNPATLPQDMATLQHELAALPGVVDVRSLNTPLGIANTTITNLTRVDGQLALFTSDDSSSGAIDAAQITEIVGGLQQYMELLKTQFPSVANDPNLLMIEEIVDGGLLTITLRQNDLMTAAKNLSATFAAMPDAYLMPPTGEGEVFAALQPLMASYIANEGSAFRMDVILDDPLGDEAQTTITQMRSLLASYTSANGQAVASGFPAVVTDLATTMSRDTLRAVGFVLAGIFVVLLVMLRSMVAPAYLIATVLLSFTCTLGLTTLFFNATTGDGRLSWIMPLFTFVFLVGLGIDYSIFLFGRIKEEVAHHGVREGVHVAVAATGAIITSAAIILAGTFAGMMVGELRLLAQMGFAVSIGVLIDAFVVRTMLDPALATLFGRWTWFPGGIPTPQILAVPETAATTESVLG